MIRKRLRKIHYQFIGKENINSSILFSKYNNLNNQ